MAGTATELTREVPAVPARTERVTVLWCRHNFMQMDAAFRRARLQMSHRMDTCFWCRRPFEDGDAMALVQIKGRRNEVLCQACAAPLSAGGGDAP